MKGEGEGEYLHLGVRKGEFGRGCGPKNWRGWSVLSVGYDGGGVVIGVCRGWIRVDVMVSRGEESDLGEVLGMGVFIVEMVWLV